jgi:hypothetical protein
VVKIETNSVLKVEELLDQLTECGFGKTWDIVMYQPKTKMLSWFTKNTEGNLVPKEFENLINQ